MKTIRIATYNIHKCIGMDRKFSPERIVDVLREIDADIIALQEVLCHTTSHSREHQADFIARELGMEFVFGENRHIRGGGYGNAVLSRFPVLSNENYDISIKKYEPRGCLRAEIEIPRARRIQFFGLHLGTSFFERRRQVGELLRNDRLNDPGFAGGRLIAGDFNEWTAGLTTRLFKSQFTSVDPVLHLGKKRTYPGFLPVLHLDHIYFDKDFRLLDAFLHRSRTAMIASDHLPIAAEFRLSS